MLWDHILERITAIAEARPAPPHPWEASFATMAAAARQEAAEARRRRDESQARHWGGRVPAERIRTLPANTWALAQFDRPLLDALDRAGPEELRAIARWAAGRAAGMSGLADVDWIAAALAALDAGDPLPAPFDDHDQAWNRLLTDPRVPNTIVTIHGTPDVLLQAAAFPALLAAAHPDPLAAAVDAIYAAATAHGDDHARFLADARAAFSSLREP